MKQKSKTVSENLCVDRDDAFNRLDRIKKSYYLDRIYEESSSGGMVWTGQSCFCAKGFYKGIRFWLLRDGLYGECKNCFLCLESSARMKNLAENIIHVSITRSYRSRFEFELDRMGGCVKPDTEMLSYVVQLLIHTNFFRWDHLSLLPLRSVPLVECCNLRHKTDTFVLRFGSSQFFCDTNKLWFSCNYGIILLEQSHKIKQMYKKIKNGWNL